ncbi:hypothetical protein D3C84_1220150 [compost metagenome]
MGQVVRFGAGAKGFTIAGNAAHRDAAKVNAVVALLATDKTGFTRLALGSPIGTRHF